MGQTGCGGAGGAATSPPCLGTHQPDPLTTSLSLSTLDTSAKIAQVKFLTFPVTYVMVTFSITS